jgi:alpha-mannosidase
VAARGPAGRVAALFCPDAALVQAGGFGFGRLLGEVPRPEKPVLLAWPINNYWYTNYPLTQPGLTVLRYGFLTSAAADTAGLGQRAREFIHPLLAHPAFVANGAREGRLLVVEGEGVLVNHAKPAADGRGTMLRLTCVGRDETTARLRPGGAPVRAAFLCGTLEDDRDALPVVDGMAEVRLRSRRLTLVRLCT